MTTHRNGGAAVVETLAAHGVDTVFGIPGTHNLELYRHLAGAGITPVTPRHEQGAGYAAEAYARVSGRPGVVVTTSGPGLTNAMTAAATAYAESSRCSCSPRASRPGPRDTISAGCTRRRTPPPRWTTSSGGAAACAAPTRPPRP